MKVVLFCGGLGMRIRDYGDNVPKPMIPIGDKPILWHLMNYYSQHGHKDFVLCLGYKANTIKEFFLNDRPQLYSDCVITQGGTEVELLGEPRQDWRITMIDTGVWRNIGERLWAVREHVEGEEMFMANYSDGLAAVNLSEMIETFKQSGKVACFLAVRPSVQPAPRRHDARGRGQAHQVERGGRPLDQRRLLHLPPADLRLHARGRGAGRRPFRRLIEADQLLAVRHDGFWRPMDTLKDRQVLEELVEKGDHAVARH